MSGNPPNELNVAGDHSPAASVSDPFHRADPPVWRVRLWPHRSLSPGGFRWIMGLTAAGLSLPLIALAPTGASLALAPYAVAAFGMLWLFLKLSYLTGRVTEDLFLWPDAIAVERREPLGAVKRWFANPYWVDIDTTDTPTIEKYLTLRGGGRRIELGTFLTPEERVELADELRSRINKLSGARR